jgi:hypothetical protein
MVNVNELSQASNTLKAADFDGGEWEVTIASYEVREFDQTDMKTGEHYKQKKPVFSFHETEQTMVCNKTNRDEIASVYGPEMDDWIGKKIILYGKMVDFAGKQTMGIRVRVERPKKQPVMPNRAQAKKQVQDELNPPPSDEVPF